MLRSRVASTHAQREAAELAAEVDLLLHGAEVVIVRRYVCHRCFQQRSQVSGHDAGAIQLERPSCQRCGWPMLTDVGARA